MQLLAVLCYKGGDKMKKWQIEVFAKMKEYGIKQKDLCEKTGFTRVWISAVLNDKWQLKQARTRKKIEQALKELINERRNKNGIV